MCKFRESVRSMMVGETLKLLLGRVVGFPLSVCVEKVNDRGTGPCVEDSEPLRVGNKVNSESSLR